MARRSFQRSYRRWIRVVEPKKSELDRQRSNTNPFSHCPQIAVVVPVSHSHEEDNLVSVRSVTDQTYRWWQLRLVIDQEQEIEIRDLAEEISEPYLLFYSQRDRIVNPEGASQFAARTLGNHPLNRVVPVADTHSHELFRSRPAVRDRLLDITVEWIDTLLEPSQAN